jgi:hypothetical protein
VSGIDSKDTLHPLKLDWSAQPSDINLMTVHSFAVVDGVAVGTQSAARPPPPPSLPAWAHLCSWRNRGVRGKRGPKVTLPHRHLIRTVRVGACAVLQLQVRIAVAGWWSAAWMDPQRWTGFEPPSSDAVGVLKRCVKVARTAAGGGSTTKSTLTEFRKLCRWHIACTCGHRDKVPPV